jgi:hypothetical protein
LFVIGPPAVGKMAVGAAIAERTGFKLIFILVWDFDDPDDHKLVERVRPEHPEVRRRIPSELDRRLRAYPRVALADRQHAS